jgi:hypothetical protein
MSAEAVRTPLFPATVPPGRARIAIAIDRPEREQLWRSLSPSGNVLAAFILARWIEQSLRRRGICNREVAPIGEILDGVIVADVTDRDAGLRVMEMVVRDSGLDQVAEIGWWDEREGVWRTHHPRPAEAPFDRFFTPERLARYGEDHAVRTRMLDDAIAQLKNSAS